MLQAEELPEPEQLVLRAEELPESQQLVLGLGWVLRFRPRRLQQRLRYCLPGACAWVYVPLAAWVLAWTAQRYWLLMRLVADLAVSVHYLIGPVHYPTASVGYLTHPVVYFPGPESGRPGRHDLSACACDVHLGVNDSSDLAVPLQGFQAGCPFRLPNPF